MFCVLTLLWLATPVWAQSAATQQQAMALALEQAQRGNLDLNADSARALRQHPLYGWLEYSVLRRTISTLSPAKAQEFIRRYQGQAVVDAFLNDWLPVLADRQEWTLLLQYWQPSEAVGKQCLYLRAQLATQQTDAQWEAHAQRIWAENGTSLPNHCDPVFTALEQRGKLTPALRWQRIEAAARARELGLMRFLARSLPAAEQQQAINYAAFIEKPDLRALQWPRDARSRQIATIGLERLARGNPDTAVQYLPQYVRALGLSAEQQARVRYQIALQTVVNWRPESALRLAQVPESSYDLRLHEWRVREALARRDWQAALAALKNMPEAQRNESRWQWFTARMLEKTGRHAEAQALYHAAARHATFHGFMAADKLNQPYALCPAPAPDAAQKRALLDTNPALLRAVELFQLQRPGWAAREWQQALTTIDAAQRPIAVAIAADYGWYDRAVMTLKNSDDLRFYSLRFPLNYQSTISAQAQTNNLDPAFVAAVIRAESIFNPQARSSANARGLMQILPGTGAQVARKIGLEAYRDAAHLFDPSINIALGTAYLRQLLQDYEQRPFMTMAAYNAGPNAVARWRGQRSHLESEIDLWIETIGYQETREYVARVMAFTVIYDWRLHQQAQPLHERLRGQRSSVRKEFACPSP